MIKIFKRSGLKVDAELDQKYYSITIALGESRTQEKSPKAEAVQ